MQTWQRLAPERQLRCKRAAWMVPALRAPMVLNYFTNGNEKGIRMQKRKLGNSNIEISPLVFGGNVFGWTADQERSFSLLDAALDAGIDTIDTADVYSAWVPGNSGGESETIIGKWLKARGQRDKVIIATKVGARMGSGEKGLSAAWITKQVEASLQRLNTDYIDLYQAHRDDPDTPLEETLQAFATLIRDGKVRTIGASNYSAARLQQALDTSDALGLPRFESLQPEYNLVARTAYETELEALLRERGLGVITYYSLASGFLSGKYRSKADTEGRARGDRVQRYLDQGGLRVLDALDAVAGRHGANPTQISLAWLLARPSVTAPIVSASRVEQIADLRAAADIELSAQDIAQLDQASA
jgi:aryl-alcohol dehydrogenase-like predicted oxidoreductase